MPRSEDVYLGPRQHWEDRRRKHWHRHLPWLLPLGACGVFILLIAGAVGVRQVILRRSHVATADVGSQQHNPAGSSTSDLSSTHSAIPPRRDSEQGASLESSEPGYEVLPPKAAHAPGRKIPKMLLVGSRPEMFQSLEDAVRAAIPGDVIEIRTNRPLLVAHAEFRRKQKIKDAVLTIRAGRGYSPVLRAAGPGPILRVANVDLKLNGLHFAAMIDSGFLESDNGDVSVSQCSASRIPPGSRIGVCAAKNSAGRDFDVTVEFSRCFMRNASGFASFSDPSIHLRIDQCGFLGGWLIDIALNEDQSVQITRSSFVNCRVLFLSRHDNWPLTPLVFRMDRCLFGPPLGCCNPLIQLAVPEPYRTRGLSGYEEALRLAVREIKARDNLGQFWDGWWTMETSAGEINVRESLFAELPEHVQYPGFHGAKLHDAWSHVWEKGDLPTAYKLLATALPEDLAVPKPEGVLADLMREGAHYGPDISQLPVPPPVTLEPYDSADVVFFEGEGLKVVRASEGLSVERQKEDDLPICLSGGTHLLAPATKPGQWIELAIPVPRAGRYSGRIYMTAGPGLGRVIVQVNKRRLGAEVDLSAREYSPLPVEFGELDLSAGDSILRIETADDSRSAANPNFAFAFDSLVLRRVHQP